jgi:hypothetical protein
VATEKAIPGTSVRSGNGRPILSEAYRDYVLVGEAAYHLGVHQNTVRYRIKIGELPAQKIKTERGETYVIPRVALGLGETARPKWYAAWWAFHWPKDWRGRASYLLVLGLVFLVGSVTGIVWNLAKYGDIEGKQAV